jgi:hypothetical protein
MRKTPVCFPADPGFTVANANPFGCVGTSFEESVHWIANLIEIPLGKLVALWPSKLNQTRVDGEPHNSSGPVFAPSVMHSGDEPTKRQGFLPAIGLYDFHIVAP